MQPPTPKKTRAVDKIQLSSTPSIAADIAEHPHSALFFQKNKDKSKKKKKKKKKQSFQKDFDMQRASLVLGILLFLSRSG